jgi:hypothetical protein
VKALLAASALAGAGLAAALSWSFRSEVASAATLPALPEMEPASDLVRSAVEGCLTAGGEWSQGIEDRVLVARCRPAPINLGVAPLPYKAPARVRP